jgi:group I intron endonuclease
MIIYKITNTITKLSYIGYTKQNLNNRWQQHYKQALKESKNRKFYNAIRKYGVNAWETEVIDVALNAVEAKNKEILYIEKYNSYYDGYNSTLGGDGNNGIVMSKESNDARSRKLKGVKKSPDTIKKFKQRTQSTKTKEKISDSHKGMKKPWVKWTVEQCRQRGLARRQITKEQYDIIHQYRSQNLTIKSIAEITGLTNDMVKKWLKMTW